MIDASEEDSEYIIAGTIGHDFDPSIELNSLVWFANFLKSQSNFSLGISEIKDQSTIEYLNALSKTTGIGDLAAAKLDFPLDMDVLDFDATEGIATFVAHLRRERNSAIIHAKKEQAVAKYKRLVCEVCEFDFSAFYGELGEGYCEVHHKTSLSSLEGKRVTTLDDLAVLCSNCHRMVHRSKPMLSITELKEKITHAKN